jgi:hypothetical protein
MFEERCCLRTFKNETCIPFQSEVATPLQIMSIPFLLLITFGLTYGFYVLIRDGINEVNRGGYVMKKSSIERSINQKKDDIKNIKLLKKLIVKAKQIPPDLRKFDDMGLNDVGRELDRLKGEIKELNEKQKDLYTQEVQANPKAQTYLYAPYSFKMRYYKLGSMAQKVTLVAILLFVPPRVITGAKMWFGSALIFIQALCASIYQPFSDGMETLMEIFAGFTNVINCVVGLLITYGIGSAALHDAILFTFNLLNFVVIIFTLIVGPLRTHLFVTAFKRKEKVLQEVKLKEFARDQALRAQKVASKKLTAVTKEVVVQTGKQMTESILQKTSERKENDILKNMTRKLSSNLDDIESKINHAYDVGNEMSKNVKDGGTILAEQFNEEAVKSREQLGEILNDNAQKATEGSMAIANGVNLGISSISQKISSNVENISKTVANRAKKTIEEAKSIAKKVKDQAENKLNEMKMVSRQAKIELTEANEYLKVATEKAAATGKQAIKIKELLNKGAKVNITDSKLMKLSLMDLKLEDLASNLVQKADTVNDNVSSSIIAKSGLTNMTNDAIIPSINKETLESSTLKVKTELENLTSNDDVNTLGQTLMEHPDSLLDALLESECNEILVEDEMEMSTEAVILSVAEVKANLADKYMFNAQNVVKQAEDKIHEAGEKMDQAKKNLLHANNKIIRLAEVSNKEAKEELSRAYEETIPYKVHNAADKVTENLKDYSDFVSEVELSKIAINVSGITPEDLEGSYWSDPEEFDSAGENYGGSDLSSYISSSSGDEDEVMD